jgi:roadblock/LC7 domain-containing protein
MTLPVDVKVFGAGAHAHYLGREMKATATLPDGREQPLLWIKDWDFNWQEQYNYKQPVLLPKGTRIDVSISYDNSADNPRNPTNPPKRVQWGEQSSDEMGGIGFNMVTLRKEDEAALSASFGDGTKAAIAKAVADGTIRRFLAAETVGRVNAAPAPQLQRITVFDRNGKILSTLGEPGLFTQPALSPDGMRVAAIKADTGTGNKDVWVFDVATGKATPVTSDATPNMSPVWSPDGKQIAYVSILDKEVYAIARRASDGSGSEELVYKQPTPGAALVLTDWSADGRICFWSGKITYAVTASGGQKPVELFHEDYNVRGGRFSPDSRFIAYNSDESGKFQTFVGPLNPVSKGQQVSKDPAAGGIFWREDSKELYFLSLPPEQAMMAVDITTSPTFQAGAPRLLFKLPSPIMAPAQLSSVASRDGERFVFIVQATAVAASTH